jgi:hypothetical protein
VVEQELERTYHSSNTCYIFGLFKVENKGSGNFVALQECRQLRRRRRTTEDLEGCPWRFRSSGSKMELVFSPGAPRWNPRRAATVARKPRGAIGSCCAVVRRRYCRVHRVQRCTNALNIVIHGRLQGTSSEGSKRSIQSSCQAGVPYDAIVLLGNPGRVYLCFD